MRYSTHILKTNNTLNYLELVQSVQARNCTMCNSQKILLPVVTMGLGIIGYHPFCPICKVYFPEKKKTLKTRLGGDLMEYFQGQFGEYNGDIDIPHFRFWRSVMIPRTENDDLDLNSCWLWMRYGDKHGYGNIHLNGRTQKTHRVSYALTHPADPLNLALLIQHQCDNPRCVNPLHLRQGTKASNSHDVFTRQAHPCAKIRPQDVLTIREAITNGVSIKELAEKFGLSIRQVEAIKQGTKWRYLYDSTVRDISVRKLYHSLAQARQRG